MLSFHLHQNPQSKFFLQIFLLHFHMHSIILLSCMKRTSYDVHHFSVLHTFIIYLLHPDILLALCSDTPKFHAQVNNPLKVISY
jgi:hypothetical protein